MATTKATKTTKTAAKTKPAKKPATKPKTATVKPKEVVAKKTNKSNKPGNIILWAIAIIAAIAVVTAVCIYACNRNQPTISIEDGKEIAAKYVSPKDAKFRILVPNDFNKVSDDEVKDQFADTTPDFVYQSKDKNANVTVAHSGEQIANDQIQNYLNVLKLAFSASASNVKSDYYTVSDHNIGVVSFNSTSTGEETYSQVAVFSENNELILINFNCTKATEDEWQKVGEGIIKSLEFTE